MRHLTLTCPECNAPSKAVGDPDEHLNGHVGVFHCFSCGADGSFVIVLTPKEKRGQ